MLDGRLRRARVRDVAEHGSRPVFFAKRAQITALDLSVAAAHVVRGEAFDVKHSPGGMVDAEFAVQFLVLSQSAAHPALWKVQDEDTTIYLFGTVHALPDRIYWYVGKVADSFEQSQELVTEIGEIDPVVMQKVMMGTGVLPKGQTLRGLMSAKDRALYEKTMARYKIPPAALEQFEPWFAALTMTSLPLRDEGIAASSGVEATLTERAKALGLVVDDTFLFPLTQQHIADALGTRVKDERGITVRDGILFGLAQALALIPGVSRSGATLTAAALASWQSQIARECEKDERVAAASAVLALPLLVVIPVADDLLRQRAAEVVGQEPRVDDLAVVDLAVDRADHVFGHGVGF